MSSIFSTTVTRRGSRGASASGSLDSDRAMLSSVYSVMHLAAIQATQKHGSRVCLSSFTPTSSKAKITTCKQSLQAAAVERASGKSSRRTAFSYLLPGRQVSPQDPCLAQPGCRSRLTENGLDKLGVLVDVEEVPCSQCVRQRVRELAQVIEHLGSKQRCQFPVCKHLIFIQGLTAKQARGRKTEVQLSDGYGRVSLTPNGLASRASPSSDSRLSPDSQTLCI